VPDDYQFAGAVNRDGWVASPWQRERRVRVFSGLLMMEPQNPSSSAFAPGYGGQVVLSPLRKGKGEINTIELTIFERCPDRERSRPRGPQDRW
jgi:hypothetical protein